MHSSLQPAHSTYQRAADSLLIEIGALSPEQRRHRPDPDTWSLNMVLHHLALIDTGVARGLADGLPENKRKPRLRQRLLAPLVKLILRSPLRVKTPSDRVLPDPDLDFPEVEGRWRAILADLEAGFEDIDAEAIGIPVFMHPIAGPRTPSQVLAFLNDHLEHHHHQVRRLREDPGFPS